MRLSVVPGNRDLSTPAYVQRLTVTTAVALIHRNWPTQVAGCTFTLR